jgi:hypothetical protein
MEQDWRDIKEEVKARTSDTRNVLAGCALLKPTQE